MARFAKLFLILFLCCNNASASERTFSEIKSAWQSSDAWLLDRHGEVLHQLRINKKVRCLQWIGLDAMSPALLAAIVQSEDKHFYQHKGVDWKALAAATVNNVFSDNKRGASTISMQLVAMLDQEKFSTPGQRGVAQKWDQIRAAQLLEQNWSKPELLEAYLNLVSFRGEMQGIAAAAQILFNKKPSGLNTRESLLLAALLPAPNAKPSRVAERACVLSRATKSDVLCSDLEILANHSLNQTGFDMPDHALHVARQLLQQADSRITSTLDARLQYFATQSLQRHLHELAQKNVADGALLVMDNASGEVLAYVGNAGEHASARYVDGVLALRQAGSTLKPFLYAQAIDKKILTAASLVDDSPMNLPTGNGLYVPQNYDHEFKGAVSVRSALAASLNIPAVRSLNLLGVESFHRQLLQLGYQSLQASADFYGHSLALGSADVSLWQQVNAYRVLANGGEWTAPVLQIGQMRKNATRVFSPQVAFIVSDILHDRAARGLTFGLDNSLNTRYWSAVKTGTSKNMRDNWCIGYSTRYTVGVWVGNFSGEAMWNVSGVSGAAPVWQEVMNYLHADVKTKQPKSPGHLVHTQVTFTAAQEAPRKEWFISGTEITQVQAAHNIEKNKKIIYPPNGTIIALDPDIPQDRQAVFFEITHAGGELTLLLDKEVVAVNNQLAKWQPRAGEHELLLRDADGVLDVVRFQVRELAEQPGNSTNH